MMQAWYAACLLAALTGYAFSAQALGEQGAALDSDRDGLSDEFENALLARFLPTFMIGNNDCSTQPAQFVPQDKIPTVMVDDGTIYGQAFPSKQHPEEVELHYYHLWRRDCGEMGHRLDAEHASALVSAGSNANEATATYWYAAAHEDTICDASQITRAETIHAQDQGAVVWISEGKHATFLSELLCRHGCGGDRCEQMKTLRVRQVVNVGEIGAPMGNIAWLASIEWPLSDKLQRTDFPASRLAQLQRLPVTDIAWAVPSKRPAQAAILGVQTGMSGAATGARNTDTALVVANNNTSTALGRAAKGTGHAVGVSSRNTWRALKKSAQKVGQAVDAHPGHWEQP